MRCDQCGEKIRFEVTYLELPYGGGTETLRFCDDLCLHDWIEEHTSIDLLEADYDD